MEKIEINGLGYRELAKLAEVLAEIAERGSYKGEKVTPTIKGSYNNRTDTLEINGLIIELSEI